MSTPVDLDLDPEQLRLDGLVQWARREADALGALLPAALDAQWQAAPNPRPREDTTERSKGVTSDPTSANALDERRWALRLQIVRSERMLREAIVALRGVRRGLEMRFDEWEGRHG